MENKKSTKSCSTSTDNIPEENIVNDQVEIFKAIADPTRLKILYLLEDKELCSCQIINSLNIPQPTISHHLSILSRAKLIKWKKKGKWKYFQLNNSKLIETIKKIN
ncbi:MAG: winged helix-turn-helix transcriptional regulator [Methanobrevibacter arboriphilus]|uniref:Winged helix-turn-helix transcriptional regulator n=1 Tax=Methanobrevibacter arboriphilus TaxID=39441 RepID=A0A843AK84_METAZ|nr:metalloregulator ArsR/SmtB family transcription factor [Methanobrevibacter arboriphilus]MBF4467948.1 winged helix-turn-helix transcriptional regulator [Methanobrevibacter arboriphilus]